LEKQQNQDVSRAWMTAATMEKWLNMSNAKMKKENRNATLFS
jgi:hypothetical protein